MSEFKRTITFSPAFDRRDPDPSKNYGIHGVNMSWFVEKDNREIQFVVFTSWHLPHVAKERRENLVDDALRWPNIKCFFEPFPNDIGYHSPEPMYEGQMLMDEDCGFTGGVCYYDGSSLNADVYFDLLVAEGGEALWRALEEEWSRRFENEEKEATA